MSDLTRKELRKLYIETQDELTTFIMDHTSTISGFGDNLVLTDITEVEYEELKERVLYLKQAYKDATS